MKPTAQPTLYGLMAEFSDSDQLVAAAARVRAGGFTKTDAFTPIPIHGLPEALGVPPSRMNKVMMAAGVCGAFIGLGLQTWISVFAYPHVVNGKPLFSWPSFFPVIFECTVLLASVTGVIVMFARSGLPRPHHPVFATPHFERASTDRFFLCIKSTDPLFDLARTTTFMQGLGADAVSECPLDGANKVD